MLIHDEIINYLLSGWRKQNFDLLYWRETGILFHNKTTRRIIELNDNRFIFGYDTETHSLSDPDSLMKAKQYIDNRCIEIKAEKEWKP